MELQLVSFEQAKSLKELGFPQEVYPWHLYDIHTGILYKDYDDSSPVYLTENDICMAPTLELAAKWLREEKDIILLPTPMVKWSESKERYYGSHYESCYTNWNSPILKTLKEKDKYGNFNPMEFATYEEALRAGIDKAIEILKGI